MVRWQFRHTTWVACFTSNRSVSASFRENRRKASQGAGLNGGFYKEIRFLGMMQRRQSQRRWQSFVAAVDAFTEQSILSRFELSLSSALLWFSLRFSLTRAWELCRLGSITSMKRHSGKLRSFRVSSSKEKMFIRKNEARCRYRQFGVLNCN